MTVLDKVAQVFAQEGLDLLDALDGLLLRLEASPTDPELIRRAMRTAHNFKGAAGTIALSQLAGAAHALEEVLQQLGASEVHAAPELFDELFSATKQMRSVVEAVAQGQRHEDAAVQVRAALVRLLAPAATLAAARHAPALGEYGVQRLRELEVVGMAGLRLTVHFASDPTPPPDRARALLAALAQDAEIIDTTPTETELDGVAESRHLTILLGTKEDAASLSARLARPDLHIEVERLAGPPPSADPSTTAGASAASATPRAACTTRAGTDERAAAQALKIDVERVDNLIDLIGELVTVESMVANAREVAGITSRQTRNHLSQLTRITREIQHAGMRMRMVPLSGLFQKVARLVRELMRKSGKRVRLVVDGEATEMDRNMVERLGDPLVHLVRNAIDHGIELPEERERRGKPKEGALRLSAFHQGGSIVIELADDGAGINRQEVLARARAAGRIAENATPTDAELLSCIFDPGFSTTEVVTELSGRGLGLDVVRRNVEAMRGRVSVASEESVGTTFRMSLPITLAIIEGMLVGCGAERYLVPTLSVIESIRPSHAMLATLTGRHEMLKLRGELIPMLRVGDLLEVADARADATEALVVVVESLGRRLGLLVDEVISQQQVVIKSVGAGIGDARLLSGAAVLPNGSVALILNIDEICARQGLMAVARPLGDGGTPAPAQPPASARPGASAAPAVPATPTAPATRAVPPANSSAAAAAATQAARES